MQKWLSVLLLLGVFAFPHTVRAQTDIKLTSIQVQLWPEYDQPSMLVIYDFKLSADTSLPINVDVRIPKDGNLVAVASQNTDGTLVDYTDYEGPTTSGDWQVITLKIQTQADYHLEYYEPINKTGDMRQFSYLWPGDYATDDFNMNVRIPVDTTNITTDPIMGSTQSSDGTSFLFKDFGPQAAGQQFTLNVNYTKTSDTLAAQQAVKPSLPLGGDTPGRVMLSNYLPYFLGGVTVVLILAGLVFFWQSNRINKSTVRKRHPRVENEAQSDVYCHQCGTRAHASDRFCRVCGTKLRVGE